MSADPNQKKRSCLLYGCLTMFGMFLVGVLIMYFSVNYAINQFVAKYTETQASVLPSATMPAADFEQLEARVQAFTDGLKQRAPQGELSLSGDEINALIARSPDLAPLRNKVAVTVEGDQIKGQVSIPLDGLNVKRLKGRYLNGSATFKVSLDNGIPVVTMETMQVKGETPPDRYLAGIRNQNLAKDILNDPQNAAQLRKLDRIEVKDGRVLIKLREPAPEAPTPVEK
jgi:hypothetical protein